MSDKEKIWYSVDGKKFLAINLADKLSLLVDEYVPTRVFANDDYFDVSNS